MKKCQCCSNRKLFMKLQHGLCTDCYNELKKCEEDYNDLLKKVTLQNIDSSMLTPSINTLIMKLKKYDNVSTTSIKSSDCIHLLEIVKKGTCTKFPSKSKITNNFSNMTKDQISITPRTTELNTNVTATSETKNITTSPENTIPPSVPTKSVLGISSELFKETQTIVTSILKENLNINELCYYTFLLKNTYLPALNKYNIKEIDDVDIENLISSTLKKASLSLRCDVSKIYSLYNYVAFSIQTTGVKIQSNDIIELAAVKIKFGKIEDTFNSLVYIPKSISPSTERKTNISNESLANAPTLDVVLRDFLDFSEGLTLVSHNSNYNYGFLKYNYEKIFGKELENPAECSMKLYRIRYKQFYGEPPKEFSLAFCCNDILSSSDIKIIEGKKSNALSAALSTYKLYEIIKNKYK